MSWIIVRVAYIGVIFFAFDHANCIVCNHKLTSLNGYIESPAYPNKYSHNLNCSWLIIVPKGRKIQLSSKTFHLESSYNCESDALYIYDGSSEQSRLYSKPFCDIHGPKGVVSSDNALFLRFITDRQDSQKGFRLQYKSFKVCDYTFNQDQGSFTSPFYPKNYKENSNCSYRITTDPSKVIVIKFIDFILENKVYDECEDSVKIYDIIDDLPRLSRTLCGNRRPPAFQSATNKVLVKFYSDELISNIGFNATFHSIIHFCGQNQFKCNNGRCISVSSLCDQVNDCFDNSDEALCSCTRFKCVKTRKCISQSFVCDGQDNCGDWTDEMNCHGKSKEATTARTTSTTMTTTTQIVKTTQHIAKCDYDQYRCKNKKCIDASLRCNGYDNCGDNTDENDCVGQCKNLNGGCKHTCSYDRNNGVTCGCYHGFVLDYDGKSCIDINECSSRPCQEKCINTEGSFICQCGKGYRLAADLRTCIDFDECSQTTFCEQRCINKVGSYECACFYGYQYSKEKNTCLDINECDINNGGCSEKCTNTIGSYTCTCAKPGYMLVSNNLPCKDTDECELGLASCGQICVNTDGSYRCQCRHGYRLDFDDHTCLDIDECQFGAASCWGDCINTEGSYWCRCSAGFREIANKTMCEDIDECQRENGGCAHLCENTFGSFQCKCLNGYVARDKRSFTCEDLNECETNPCDQKCINTPGSYSCQCSVGYNLVNQTNCIDIDECQMGVSGCEYECLNTPGSFICTCADGYAVQADGKSCVRTSNATDCYRLHVDSTKITSNKWTTSHNEWPWPVKLSLDFIRVRIPRYNCMGLLVHARFVLATSDCLRYGPFAVVDTDRLTLTIGGHGDSDVYNIRAEKLIFNPQYDVALVKLKNKVKFGKNLQKICLPKSDYDVDTNSGEKLVVINRPSNRRNAVPVHTFVEIVESTNCLWNGKNIFSESASICVSFNTDEVSLPMSGSPLVGILRGASLLKRKQKWILTGFLIRGSAYPNYKKSFFGSDTDERQQRNVGYLKASLFTPWLKKTINDELS